MEDLVKKYRAHKVIVLSHYVLTIDGTFSTQGNAIYNRLKYYPNFILMIGGHITQGDGESKRSDTYNGHTVHTLSSDYQTRTKGGNGLLRIYKVDPSNNTINVQTYSPYTNTYETDANSSFTLQSDLSTPAKPFSLIGDISNVQPGSTASKNWPVEQNTAYEWYVSVSDGEKTTKGPMWSFTANYSVATQSKAVNQPVVERSNPARSNRLFSLYPNPTAANKVNIFFFQQQEGPVTFEIYDMYGAIRYRQSFIVTGNTVSLNHGLTNGTYTILIKTKTATESQKLIVLED